MWYAGRRVRLVYPAIMIALFARMAIGVADRGDLIGYAFTHFAVPTTTQKGPYWTLFAVIVAAG